MSLRTRMVALVVLLVMVPAISAMLVTRELVDQSLNLGLSAEISHALEAGVRQARSSFQTERAARKAEGDRWVEKAGISAAPEVARFLVHLRSAEDPAALSDELGGYEHIFVEFPDGSVQTIVRREDVPAEPETTVANDNIPTILEVNVPLDDGGVLGMTSTVETAWREDAASLSTALQMLTGLQSNRSALETGFWLPFLVIYGVSLILAVLASTHLVRGVTEPVSRLVEATEAISRGDWEFRVPARGNDELGRLGDRFNKMVGALDAQSRHLNELEKLSGWREMARALAHEVMNPLTPIRLTVEEMNERYRGSDAEYKSLLSECSAIVVKEVESLRRVVERFREFSRPVEPEFEECNLNETISDVAAMQRDLEVVMDLDPEVGIVTADCDRLRQVLMNLSRNAHAATRETEGAKLRFATRVNGDHVILIVEDNGPGIPPEARSRVFEPYQTGTAKGLGLGLALVRGIVMAHGGTIEIESGSEGGARFRIELPRNPEVKNA